MNQLTVKTNAPDVALQPVTEVTERIDMMLANRSHIIERVKPLLIENVDVYALPGMKKPSLGKPGAEKLAAVFGLRASFKIDDETIRVLGDVKKKYVAYICTLSYQGEFAGEGRGATFVEFERTNYRNVNASEFAAIKSTLNSNDYQEKEGNYGKYYRVKDGTVFDQLALNKAIKMAQKSAFVDAVIRTTGMSDLFTQDVEDMDFDNEMPIKKEEINKSTVESKPMVKSDSDPKKQCPFCRKWHTGQYPKCYECWKREKNGEVITSTKTIINHDADPFQS